MLPPLRVQHAGRRLLTSDRKATLWDTTCSLNFGEPPSKRTRVLIIHLWIRGSTAPSPLPGSQDHTVLPSWGEGRTTHNALLSAFHPLRHRSWNEPPPGLVRSRGDCMIREPFREDLLERVVSRSRKHKERWLGVPSRFITLQPKLQCN